MTLDERLVLAGPLEAVVGDDLLLVCTAPSVFNSNELQLLEDGVLANDPRITLTDTNEIETARTFTLSNTVIADNGRSFSCSIFEITGLEVVVSILCEFEDNFFKFGRGVGYTCC